MNFAAVDLEKDLDRVYRNVAWWALRKLGQLVRIVQSMFGNARNHVIANGTLSYDFLVEWECSELSAKSFNIPGSRCDGIKGKLKEDSQ